MAVVISLRFGHPDNKSWTDRSVSAGPALLINVMGQGSGRAGEKKPLRGPLASAGAGATGFGFSLAGEDAMDDEDAGSFFTLKSHAIYVPHHHFAADAIARGDIPEQHVDATLQAHIRPGQTVVDVGANIGFHTLTMADAVQHGTVYAIEADIENAACLARTIRRNGIVNTRLLPVAASAAPGIIHMANSDRTNSSFSPLAKISTKIAACARLDDCISERVDLLKIDIEGAELLALLGMPRLLMSRPTLVMEFSPGYIERNLGVDRSCELLALIFGLGYACYYISPSGEIERLMTAEAVVVKRDFAFHHLGWGHIDLLCTAQ